MEETKTKKEVEAQIMPGGWSAFQCVNKEATQVFEKALQGFVGVSYTPVAFATQVVAGTNFRFFCNARIVYPESINEAAIISIYQPPNGIPQLTGIKRVYF